MKIKKKSVESQAQDSLNVVKGKTVEKKGNFVDHSQKHLNENSVGMSVGTTINMGDYESLRVDCWATVPLEDGETMEDGMERIFAVLDKKLRETVSSYTDSEDKD